MRLSVMFITAVCVLFLVKLRWPKKKSIYDILSVLIFPDVDECNSNIPVCDVNAKCQNTIGSYNCSCKAGLTGDGKRCHGKQDELFPQSI